MSERDWVSRHPSVRSYISEICGQVKAKDVHGDIEQEMISHLEELAEEMMADQRLSRDEAVTEALKHMGGAVEVGRGFHAVHRPKPEWSVIALIAGMIVIAVLALFAMPSYPYGKQAYNDVKWFCGGVGIALMFVFYFVDYRKLLIWSWPLYWLTICLMTYTWLFGPEVNGAREFIAIGAFGLNVFSLSSYLLLIAIAGLLYRGRDDAIATGHPNWLSSVKALQNLAAYVWIPSFLYLTSPTFSAFIPYAVGLFVLLALSGKIRLLLASGATMVLGGVLVFADVSRWMYLKDRLSGILSFNWAGSYQTKFNLSTIQSGGLWGQGFDFASPEHPPIQSYSEMIFPNLVYSLGWVFGSFVVIVVFGFVFRTLRMGHRLHDYYGKYIVLGIGTLFAVRLVWNLLMSLGLVPVIGFDLPILSWSSVTIFEFAAAGLMLGIYRRKDMIGRLQSNRPVA